MKIGGPSGKHISAPPSTATSFDPWMFSRTKLIRLASEVGPVSRWVSGGEGGAASGRGLVAFQWSQSCSTSYSLGRGVREIPVAGSQRSTSPMNRFGGKSTEDRLRV